MASRKCFWLESLNKFLDLKQKQAAEECLKYLKMFASGLEDKMLNNCFLFVIIE